MSLISNRCLSISLPQCCHKAGDIFKTVSKIVKLFHLANYYRQNSSFMSSKYRLLQNRGFRCDFNPNRFVRACLDFALLEERIWIKPKSVIRPFNV